MLLTEHTIQTRTDRRFTDEEADKVSDAINLAMEAVRASIAQRFTWLSVEVVE